MHFNWEEVIGKNVISKQIASFFQLTLPVKCHVLITVCLFFFISVEIILHPTIFQPVLFYSCEFKEHKFSFSFRDIRGEIHVFVSPYGFAN